MIMKMKKNIEFLKMSGGGNDFIVVDNRNGVFPKNKSVFTKKICSRKIAVGADGVILLEKSGNADFKMRILNADGSEAEMCGNGARCVAHFAYNNKIAGMNTQFETKAGIIEAKIISDNVVKIKMSKPFDFKKNIDIKIGSKKVRAAFINTGVPHTVIFTAQIKNVDVEGLGKIIRYHKLFSPQGTNVDFISIKDKHSLYIRTYERGVEQETLSCGTGSVAAALIAGLNKNLKSPLKIITKSGDVYTIYFNIEKDGNINEVYLEGSVEVIYSGILN